MTKTQKYLSQNSIAFALWCMIAAFGAYFCMYALRKPFSTGVYSGLTVWGVNYKTILLLSQVFGYMLSKFIGIKVVSELNPQNRTKILYWIIGISYTSLLLFAIIPYPYNFICLFFNGLPLGMVWGLLFSYLEGRKLTELLAIGLSLCIIVASGILKTVYLTIAELFTVSEFVMPALIGGIFIPFFLLFIYMLRLIPPPDAEDVELKAERTAMTNDDKANLLKKYGFGIVVSVLLCAFCTLLRDFRDDFAVEIYKEVNIPFDKSFFAKMESIIAISVLVLVGVLVFIKKSQTGLWLNYLYIFVGLAAISLSTLFFQKSNLDPTVWLFSVGFGLFMVYIPLQTAFFERLIGTFKMKSNAGFLVYLCDSFGYLSTVGMLIYREFYLSDVSFVNTLIQLSYFVAIVGLVLWFSSLVYFYIKSKKIVPLFQPLVSVAS